MPGSSSDSGPIPQSQPSSGPDATAPVRGTVFPLVLAVAAAASCWNLLGAPFAVVTAVVALMLALRVRPPPGRARIRVRIATALSAIALIWAVLVLATSFRGATPGAAVPGAPAPGAAEARRVLDDAERQTAERRQSARRELEREGSPPDTQSGALR